MTLMEGFRLASQVPGSALLECEAAFAKLKDAFAATRQGKGRMVFVGWAGIGKTSLFGTFCSQRAKDARVLVGWCDGLRTPRPLAPFVDIWEEVGGCIEQLRRGTRGRRGRQFVLLVDDALRG